MILPKESNEEYHKRSELSSSDIKYMLITPMHFKKMVLEKDKLVKEPNSAFDVGSCAHECFLEQDTSLFVSLPEGLDRRTKDGKATYEAFIKENEGKRIITNDQHKTVLEMFDVISSNKEACELLKGSQVEVGATYIDPVTGLPCRFKPDILNIDRGFIADYKTCMSAAPHEFSKAIARYNYHLSAAHYLTGANVIWPIKDYYFIAQEKTYPYAVAIYKMDASDIIKSFNFRNEVMAKIKRHKELDIWPDWSEKILPITIPGYAYNFSDQN